MVVYRVRATKQKVVRRTFKRKSRASRYALTKRCKGFRARVSRTPRKKVKKRTFFGIPY